MNRDNSMRDKEVVVCEDEYEAKKLMGILSPTREHHNLKDITSIGEKELILVLDDDSSHSVMMYDEESVERLQRAVHMMLFERKHYSIRVHRNTVHLDINNSF